MVTKIIIESEISILDDIIVHSNVHDKFEHGHN